MPPPASPPLPQLPTAAPAQAEHGGDGNESASSDGDSNFQTSKNGAPPPQSHINRDRGFTHQSDTPADGNPTSKGNVRNIRSDGSVRSDISDLPQETGPDTEYLQPIDYPREPLYHDGYNSPVPKGVLAELPQCLTRFSTRAMWVLGHPHRGPIYHSNHG